jgi:hypothetical protein
MIKNEKNMQMQSTRKALKLSSAYFGDSSSFETNILQNQL